MRGRRPGPRSRWLTGDLAFHSSQTDGAKSSGVDRPAAESSRRRCMITAPEPMWDRTSATPSTRFVARRHQCACIPTSYELGQVLDGGSQGLQGFSHGPLSVRSGALRRGPARKTRSGLEAGRSLLQERRHRLLHLAGRRSQDLGPALPRGRSRPGGCPLQAGTTSPLWVIHTPNGLFPTISSATARAASSNSPSATTRLTRPMRRASADGISLPVSISSRRPTPRSDGATASSLRCRSRTAPA